jgi:hypothetical protein
MNAPLKTFDQVWEEGEALFKDQVAEDDLDSTLKELELKIGLYRLLAEKKEFPVEEMKAAKMKTMGEILLSMTHLSLLENINVYAALKETVLYRGIDHFAEKHKLEV